VRIGADRAADIAGMDHRIAFWRETAGHGHGAMHRTDSGGLVGNRRGNRRVPDGHAMSLHCLAPHRDGSPVNRRLAELECHAAAGNAMDCMGAGFQQSLPCDPLTT